MRTKDGVATPSELVRSSLRLRPDRIPIGEVRGAEALDLLKPGEAAIPAASERPMPARPSARCCRLEQLIQEAVVTVPRAMIAETIDLVAVLSGRGSARAKFFGETEAKEKANIVCKNCTRNLLSI